MTGPQLVEAFGERKTPADWGRDSRSAVSAGSIRARLKAGWPPEDAITKPPTGGQGVTDPDRVGEQRRCHNCKALQHTGYSRCPRCRARRAPSDRAQKKKVADEELTPECRQRILDGLRAGRALPDLCDEEGLSVNRVHRYRTYDEQWATDVDAALMDGRDPSVPHGTASGYRWHKCRCPECRATKG